MFTYATLRTRIPAVKRPPSTKPKQAAGFPAGQKQFNIERLNRLHRSGTIQYCDLTPI